MIELTFVILKDDGLLKLELAKGDNEVSEGYLE